MAGKSGPHVASADPAASEDTSDPSVPAEDTQMEVDDSHKITHRCPITFAREFEMRRHIRTVHIAEEVRAVVEGRLARSEATVSRLLVVVSVLLTNDFRSSRRIGMARR